MNDIPSRPQVMGSTHSSTELTPTQEVVAKRNDRRTAMKEDALGRIITVKWLTPLERMRVAKLLGKDADNSVVMGYAALAASVTHIDDEPVGIATYRELEALMDRLGEEGYECVGETLATEFKDKFKGVDLDVAKN